LAMRSRMRSAGVMSEYNFVIVEFNHSLYH